MIKEEDLKGRPEYTEVNYKSKSDERERLRQKYLETLDASQEYVSFDFETMALSKTSACAIGMTKMKDGKIIDRYYSLIKPVKDKANKEETFRYLHGLRLKDCNKAPDFGQLYEEIIRFMGNAILVAHNATFDIDVFKELCRHYNKPESEWEYLVDPRNVICTYALTGCTLDLASELLNVRLDNHHEAKSDADACLEILTEVLKRGFPIDDETLKRLRKKNNEVRKLKDEMNKQQVHIERLKERNILFRFLFYLTDKMQ